MYTGQDSIICRPAVGAGCCVVAWDGTGKLSLGWIERQVSVVCQEASVEDVPDAFVVIRYEVLDCDSGVTEEIEYVLGLSW